MKQLDGENTKKSKEVEELQARVAADEENEEEARRVSFGLKQKIVATEASKEQALKEVQNDRVFFQQKILSYFEHQRKFSHFLLFPQTLNLFFSSDFLELSPSSKVR